MVLLAGSAYHIHGPKFLLKALDIDLPPANTPVTMLGLQFIQETLDIPHGQG